ncbi:retrovirus-related pol polyprotein from transposon TNT 1-94 [Tanacetum coccineum]
MHMLTKPQVFYDNIHKQALGYQNPFYLKKAQRIKPTLYDGIVISAKHVAMPVIDDEDTLILKEDSRSKMSEKEKDPEAIKQNISHKPINYEKLNRLSKDFGKLEVPSELPKVILVNASVKNLKFHLAQFDYVAKKRTTPDARTEDLLNEIMEVQTVFDQMDAIVQQSSIDKQCLEIAKKELLLENDRLLQQIMSQDVLLTVMNSMSLIGEYVNMERKRNESYDKCFNLDVGLLKSQNAHNDLLKSYSQLEKHCISLKLSIQLNQEIFQKHEYCDNQNALKIPEFFKNNDLKAQVQDKDTTICKLKEIIKSMRKKSKEENVNYDYCEIETKNVKLENSVAKLLSENKRLCKEINHVKHIFKDQFDSIKRTCVRTKEQCDSLIDKLNLKCAENEDLKAQIQDKLDLDPLAPRLFQNKEAHIDYLKYTQEQANILQGIIEQAKAKQPLDNALDFACKRAQRIQELLVYVQDTCPNAIKLSGKKVVVTPKNNVKKVRIENRVVELIRDVDVKHSLLKANFELIFATCKKSMFDGVHDMCLLDFVGNINSRAKSTKKHKKQNIWKSTGHVFTEVGLKWKPTGRTFTIVGSSKKAKIVESKNANHLEPTHTWGSNATDIPSSSSFVMTGYPYCSLVSRLQMFETYDREPLSAHELSRTPQQNGVVKRQNQTLVEAARIMLIFSKAPLFLWDEAIIYSIVIPKNVFDMPLIQQNSVRAYARQETNYHSFMTFGSLCLSTNDHEDLKDRINTDTINVKFDELSTMASEQFSSRPGLHYMTPATSSTGLGSNPVSQQPCLPPKRDDWDRLFQPTVR